MIRFLTDCIDQLDLASDQLALRDRNFDRFALMLIDNVAELALHRYAQTLEAKERLRSVVRATPSENAKAIARALGRAFDAKVKLAKMEGFLTTAEADSILVLHEYRNSAYHQGLRHEGILHHLAALYATILCDALARYKPGSWSYSPQDPVPHRARKYLGEISGLPSLESFEAGFLRLKEVFAPYGDDLSQALARDMEATIEEVNTAIQFLADDSPNPTSRDDAVRQSQAWPFAFTDEAVVFAASKSYRPRSMITFVEWLADNYFGKASADPIPSWRTRLASLRGESEPHMALLKFHNWRRQSEKLREDVMDAARQLDAHIDAEIDRMRGK